MDHKAHEAIHWLEHIWPFVVAAAITVATAVKLGWMHMRKTFVSQSELKDCKTDVLHRDADAEKRILAEIKELRKDTKELQKDFIEEGRLNAKDHENIIKDNSEKFERLMSEIIRLHSGD